MGNSLRGAAQLEVSDLGSRGDTYEHQFVVEQSRDGCSEADTFRRRDMGKREKSQWAKKPKLPAGGFIYSVRKDSTIKWSQMCSADATFSAGEAIERHHQV